MRELRIHGRGGQGSVIASAKRHRYCAVIDHIVIKVDYGPCFRVGDVDRNRSGYADIAAAGSSFTLRREIVRAVGKRTGTDAGQRHFVCLERIGTGAGQLEPPVVLDDGIVGRVVAEAANLGAAVVNRFTGLQLACITQPVALAGSIDGYQVRQHQGLGRGHARETMQVSRPPVSEIDSRTRHGISLRGRELDLVAAIDDDIVSAQVTQAADIIQPDLC